LGRRVICRARWFGSGRRQVQRWSAMPKSRCGLPVGGMMQGYANHGGRCRRCGSTRPPWTWTTRRYLRPGTCRGPRTACNPGMVSGTALSGGELDAPLAGGDPAHLLGELPAVAFMVPRRCTGARMHCPERERADGPVLSRLVMADQSRTRRSPPRPMAIGLRHGQNCVSELPKVSGR